MKLLSNSTAVVELRAGLKATVTISTGGTGLVERLNKSGTVLSSNALGSAASLELGPYLTGQDLRLTCFTGDLTHSEAVITEQQVLPSNIAAAIAGKTVVIVPPSTNPLVAGALWNNAGTLAISAG